MAPLIVIVGETASGKSALALELAKRFNGEIIAADSWTVYREFDIGTAKPSPEEQKQIKHHLIDIIGAEQGFNAALFQELANKAIRDIHSRGKLPILVGGTVLYVDSILFNFGFLPVVDAVERAARNAKSLEELLTEARARGIDLTGIDTRNKRRVIRALEGRGQRPTASKMRTNTLILGIRTPREQLRERVAKRVNGMLEQGLEEEVKKLAKRYGWDVEPMKGIGYREFKDYFEGRQTLEEVKEHIISSTVQNLAKRQRAWFKRNKSIHWLDNNEQAFSLVEEFLNKVR